MSYHFDAPACTAQEAFDIAGHMSAKATFCVLPKFVNELRDISAAQRPRESLRVHFAHVEAAIFTAGRIQGIREERQRRKGGNKE